MRQPPAPVAGDRVHLLACITCGVYRVAAVRHHTPQCECGCVSWAVLADGVADTAITVKELAWRGSR
jgi:hypothetical protein